MKPARPVLVAVDLYGDAALQEIEAVDPAVRARRFDGLPGRDVLEGVEILFASGFQPSAWSAPALRWIQAFKAGVDDLPPPPAGSGVTVTTTAGVLGAPIAEHVFALLLALVRRLPRTLEAQRQARWLSWKEGEYLAAELTGKTLAVLGLGGIGRHVAWRGHAFGMRVLGVRRSADRAAQQRLEVALENGVAYEVPVVTHPVSDLAAVLAESEVVVVALPLTPETRRLLDRAHLANIRRGAILVNVSRGPIVDEEALVDLLRSGALGGAGLDVFADEPLPASSPLWRLPNVVVTPHVAGVSELIGARVLAFFRENLGRYLRGEELRNVVDPPQWHGHPSRVSQ